MNRAGIAAWAGFPRRHPAWTVVAGFISLLVLVFVFVDWNWARGPVQRIVSGVTGREFRIAGDLDIDFLPLEVKAEKVYFGNASWSAEPAMARIEKVDLRVRFWPLLAGRFTLPRISLEQPWLRLERNAEGLGNWALSNNCRPDGCPRRLRIQQLYVRDGQLEVREPALQTALDINFESTTPASRNALAPLVLHGRGTYRNAPFGIAGHVDSPLALQGKPLPYELDLTVQAGDTQARASGTLEEPLQTQDVAVNFELKGADLAELYDLIGIALPRTPPYNIRGLLSRHGNRYAYEGFTGTVGDSDLSGIASIDTGGPRPKLTANLKSSRIDFDDLSGFIGGNPGTGEGETASAQQKKASQAQRASGKRLPSKPINFSKLRSMDADVQLVAAKVESPKLPLESMSAHLLLEDGLLTLTPLNFGAAGGQLAASVRVDARREPADFTLAMQVRQLQLPKLMPKAKPLRDSTGSINGVVNLDGHGNSAATILGTADGELGFIMGPGQMSNLLLEIAGLDVAETLGFLIGKDQQVRLRCAYADFNVNDGIATARSVAIDTTDTALLIRGDFSFRSESLDLTLLPRPKDMSPISIRTPIKIGGTFADPSFAPKGGPLLLRGAAVAALASVAPPLALLGLIETGPGDDTNCGREPPQAEDKKGDEKLSRPTSPPKRSHKT
jgi:AsmA family protein